VGAEGRGTWLERAACRGTDIEIWFPVHKTGVLHKYREQSPAIELCAACPVWAECRAYARTIPLVEGVWAGVEYKRGKPVA